MGQAGGVPSLDKSRLWEKSSENEGGGVGNCAKGADQTRSNEGINPIQLSY